MIAVGVALSGALSNEAVAQPTGSTQTVARTYLQSGVEHFTAGRFTEAAAAFQEAHALTHRPELLFNLGLSRERAGNLEGALEAYSLFASAGAPGDDQAQMQSRIANLRARIVAQQAAAANATSNTPAPTPTATPTPPPPEVRTTLITERVEVRYERSTVHAVGPWVLLGAGAVVTLVGGLAGLGANQVATDVAAANRGEQAWSADLASRYAGHDGSVAAAYGLSIAGAAMMVGGGLWLALRGPGRRREVSVGPLGALLLPGGGGMFTVGGAL